MGERVVDWKVHWWCCPRQDIPWSVKTTGLPLLWPMVGNGRRWQQRAWGKGAAGQGCISWVVLRGGRAGTKVVRERRDWRMGQAKAGGPRGSIRAGSRRAEAQRAAGSKGGQEF